MEVLDYDESKENFGFVPYTVVEPVLTPDTLLTKDNSERITLVYENVTEGEVQYIRNNVFRAIMDTNAKNVCGDLDYNKYGKKNGRPLERVSELYCDGFLLSVRVATQDLSPAVKLQTLKNTRGHICGFVKSMGLVTNDVRIRRESAVVADPKEVCFHRRGKHEHRYVIYKVGVPNVDLGLVLGLLTSKRARNDMYIFLEDVDLTIDYSGSFKRAEVIDHLLTMEGYKLQHRGYDRDKDAPVGTVMDNVGQVGANCVTFVQNLCGYKIRSKIYDKLVQMLESKGVQDNVGNHWKNWITQKDTRLANGRDSSTERGLTRLETTLYCGDDADMETLLVDFQEFLENMHTLFPSYLVWDTPHEGKWKVLTESFQHSLVVHNRTEDEGVVVYNYNEHTRKTSGIPVKKFQSKLAWCLGNITLNPGLPIDVISYEITEEEGASEEEGTNKDLRLEVEYTTLQKVFTQGEKTPMFGTRVVDSRSVFSHCKDLDVDEAIRNCGFTDQPNCCPYVSNTAANIKSKVPWEFYSLFTDNDVRNPPELLCKRPEISTNEIMECVILHALRNVAKILEQNRKGREKALKAKQERQALNKKIAASLSRKIMSFSSLPIGEVYGVLGTKLAKDKFKPGLYKDVIALDNGNAYWGCAATTEFLNTYHSEREYGKIYIADGIVLSRTGTGVAGHGRTYAIVEMMSNKKKPDVEVDTADTLRTVPETHRLQYKELTELTNLPLHKTLYPDGMYNIRRHNKDQLVVTSEGKHYRAGKDLEAQRERLIGKCGIRLGKVRTNTVTRKKYVECVVFSDEQWWMLAPIAKLSVTYDPKPLSVVAVDTVPKTLLVLSEDGTIHKLHKGGVLYKSMVDTAMVVRVTGEIVTPEVVAKVSDAKKGREPSQEETFSFRTPEDIYKEYGL